LNDVFLFEIFVVRVVKLRGDKDTRALLSQMKAIVDKAQSVNAFSRVNLASIFAKIVGSSSVAAANGGVKMCA
jgi:hypothetical protein